MNREATMPVDAEARGFVRELGLFDSTMIVAGSMIGSGIFIVSADIARLTGSPGWLLLTWIITGLLTVAGALCYGELAAMMPAAGGQYVYLRESYSPLWGFLYGWTFFLVIQTGTIAAVAVAFARYLGILVPWIAAEAWIVPPITLSSGYAVSLSTQQLAAIAMIAALTAIHTRGVRLGKLIQNTFTAAKTLSLIALIGLGVLLRREVAIVDNFGDLWSARAPVPVEPRTFSFLPVLSAAGGALGLLVAVSVAQVGSLFSSDAWNNVTFTAGEVKEPRRTIPLALALGTVLVVGLYTLANVAYLCTLPFAEIQSAPEDRVATAALRAILGEAGAVIMSVAIVVSTFGCNNGLVLAGARVYFAMARDGLFFAAAARLNDRHVPAVGLVLQCVWASLLVLPRTRSVDPGTGAVRYGNLYGNLLDYVVFAVLVFYVLSVAALFVLRRKRPEIERRYRAFGYPIVPALYIGAASTIMLVLLLYRTETTWPGLFLVLTGVPVYYAWRGRRSLPS